jgi:putative nucleotidyltransferase with HDIG domain
MDKVRKHLDKVEVLPPSPTLLPKLLPKLSDVDTNFDEVVEIIALDPALTSKLLQICNSAYFGQESEVNSVSDAVNRVGYQAVYLLVAMINGSGCFPQAGPGGADAAKLWRHSVSAAFNSKFVAESAEQDGALAFTAGLLHDLGKIILGQEPLPAGVELFRGPSDTASLQKELELFECDHAEVGAALLDQWKLPTPIVAAVRHHHEPKAAAEYDQVAACVCLGNLVTHSQDRPRLLEQPEFKQLMEHLNLPLESLKRWRERMRDHESLVSGMSRLPI